MGDGEGAVSARALGMHAPFGDHLAVEMGKLFQKPDILQQRRAARACGHDILIVGNRCACIGGELLFVSHGKSPPSYIVYGFLFYPARKCLQEGKIIYSNIVNAFSFSSLFIKNKFFNFVIFFEFL